MQLITITFRRKCCRVWNVSRAWFVLWNVSVKINDHPPYYILHLLSSTHCVYMVFSLAAFAQMLLQPFVCHTGFKPQQKFTHSILLGANIEWTAFHLTLGTSWAEKSDMKSIFSVPCKLCLNIVSMRSLLLTRFNISVQKSHIWEKSCIQSSQCHLKRIWASFNILLNLFS